MHTCQALTFDTGGVLLQDEFAFINQITPRHHQQSSVIQGIGDDAALFSADERFEQIICTDTIVEGVHFTLETMSDFDIGWKALAVNISDVAAMGGIPLYYLVSVAVPAHHKCDLEAVYQGMSSLASNYDMDLIGGDMTSVKESLLLSVTVLGCVDKNRHLLRAHAKSGDAVFVTGTLGDSAAGLSLLLQHGRGANFSEKEMSLVKAQQRPEPQVKAGRLLAATSAQMALNDISDGLASEANEIAAASGVRIILYEDRLPISKALQASAFDQQQEWMLYGGEDFQLLGTVPAALMGSVQQLFDKAGIPLTFIGCVEKGPPQVTLQHDGKKTALGRKGFNHFNR